MPQMTGVELLEKVRVLFPNAKRARLTAYADNEVAVRAINLVRLDYYLMKPWDPPIERLYPVLGDLLGDWKSDYRPAVESFRVIGLRWSPDSHAVRDFLARNQIPFQWLDLELRRDECNHLLETARAGAQSVPLVLFPDGNHLARATVPVLAERLGLKRHADRPFYDLAIIGAGSAGLGAAVNASSKGLKTLRIEREAPGGQAGTSSRIKNYMGFLAGLSRAYLTRRVAAQAKRFGTEILAPQEFVKIRAQDQYRILTLGDRSEVSAHAVMITTGVQWRRLAMEGIARLSGAGIYYGASMSEATACADEHIYPIGSANSAGQAAVHFCKYAAKVMMLVRADSLAKSMSQYLIDQIAGTPNIEVRMCEDVTAVHGDTRLEAITIRDQRAGSEGRVPCASMFICIGAEPNTGWLEGCVARDPNGFILAGSTLRRGHPQLTNWTLDRDPLLFETSMPGVFATAGNIFGGGCSRDEAITPGPFRPRGLLPHTAHVPAGRIDHSSGAGDAPAQQRKH